MYTLFIYDTVTGYEEEFDPRDVKAKLRSYPKEKYGDLHVWQDGWAEWKPLLQVPNLIPSAGPQPPPRPKRGPKPPAPSPELAAKRAEAPKPRVTADAGSRMAAAVQAPAVASETPMAERRRSERYDIRFKITMICDNVIFRTHTKDFSRHGLRLEQAVPPNMLNRELECYLSSPLVPSGLRFRVKVIPGQKELISFEFTNTDERLDKVIRDWVNAVRASGSGQAAA